MKSVYYSFRLVYSRIIQDKLLREASALTYQSFLSIAPLLAVFFGIAKGFGLDAMLEKWMLVELADHQEILSYFLQFSRTTLQQASGGVIAGFGIFLLLFTIVRLLSAVENVLTEMWGLHKGRSFLKKMSDYLAILLICPLLLAASSSATIFIASHLLSLTDISFLSSAKPVVQYSLTLFPFITSTILFSLILYIMPCSPVTFRAAIVAGAFSAVSFLFIQSWYIVFQLRLTKVSAIYGSFVALPLFLVWLWISWLIVLIGGELAVFFQERGWRTSVYTYSYTLKEQLETDVTVLNAIKNNFSQENPITLYKIFTSFSLPIRALTESVHRLESKHLIHTLPLQSSPLIPCKKADTATLLTLLFSDSTFDATLLNQHVDTDPLPISSAKNKGISLILTHKSKS